MISEAKVREFVAGLPETDEHPHFERIAFRVGGKIFGSFRPGESDMNLRLTDGHVETMVAVDDSAYRMVQWGKSRNWLNVNLKRARAEDVRELLEDAWRERAPKRLLD
jgi:hypothetical protein